MDEINLSSETSGQVIWRNPKFVVGGRIKEGEELIHIEATKHKTLLANAEQNFAEAALTLQQEERHKRQALKDWKRSGISDKPSPLALREPQLSVAKSRYKAAKAAVAEAKNDPGKTRLKAPFDAVIVQRHIAQGSYLSPATPKSRLCGPVIGLRFNWP